jgi:hypothetical protein
MISDIDIKDWVILTTPLKLKELKEGDVFSLFGDNRMYKLQHVLVDIVYAETAEIWNALVFPRTLEVFPWVINKNVNQNDTSN